MRRRIAWCLLPWLFAWPCHLHHGQHKPDGPYPGYPGHCDKRACH